MGTVVGDKATVRKQRTRMDTPLGPRMTSHESESGMNSEDILRCRRSSHCINATSRTNTLDKNSTTRVRTPDWATTPGGLCRMDTTLVHRAISELAGDYHELGDLLGKGAQPLAEHTGGTRELPVPIRLGVEALQAAIVDEAERWAWPVAERAGLDYTDTGRADYRLHRATRILLDRWPYLLDVPPTEVVRIDGREETSRTGRNPRAITTEDGVEGALTLLALHEQVAAVAGRTHRAERLWTPCPKCERLAIERPEGAGHVECRRCHYREPWERYEERASILARAYGAETAA